MGQEKICEGVSSKIDMKFREPARSGRYIIGTPSVLLYPLHVHCAHVRTCCTKAQLNRD